MNETELGEWEEAWRQADSPEKRRFLDREAARRGKQDESLIGFLRATYPKGHREALQAAQAAEKAGEAAAAASTAERLEPASADFGDPG